MVGRYFMFTEHAWRVNQDRSSIEKRILSSYNNLKRERQRLDVGLRSNGGTETRVCPDIACLRLTYATYSKGPPEFYLNHSKHNRTLTCNVFPLNVFYIAFFFDILR